MPDVVDDEDEGPPRDPPRERVPFEILERLERLERHAGLPAHKSLKPKTAAEADAERAAIKKRQAEDAAVARQRQIAEQAKAEALRSAEVDGIRLAQEKAHADFKKKRGEVYNLDGSTKAPKATTAAEAAALVEAIDEKLNPKPAAPAPEGKQ